MERGFHELVPRLGIVIRAELVAAAPQGGHAGAQITFDAVGIVRIGLIGDERTVHRPNVLRIIRIGHLVAEVTLDTIRVARCKAGPVGRRRPASKPSRRTMTAYAQVTSTVEILFGHREGRPENRIAPGVRHHAATPVVSRLDRRVVTTVTVVALVRRLQVAYFPRLGSRLLNIRWHDLRGRCDAQGHERKAQKYKSSYIPHVGTPIGNWLFLDCSCCSMT